MALFKTFLVKFQESNRVPAQLCATATPRDVDVDHISESARCN